MRRIAISGLVALATVLGGVAVTATAIAQPTAAMRPGITARPAEAVVEDAGTPLISCLTVTDCLGIVGSSSLNNPGQPAIPTRVARWNGSSWKRLGVAMPKGTRSADLLGVSCKGPKSCLVVGDYYTSTSLNATAHLLALFYNGTSLKPTPMVPLPKGATDVRLSGVSCVSTRYCVALGEAGGDTAAFGDNGALIIIETWNGAKWTLHTAATSIGTTVIVPSVVSCATSAFCLLTGVDLSMVSSSVSGLYVASWNGKMLTTMKPATVDGGMGFLLAAGVSCATASKCAVTGAYSGRNASTATAFTEIWNGKTWRLAKVTWPKGADDSTTIGVSCYTARSCEAVGVDAIGTSVRAAAVSFNGTTGTLQAVPAPPAGDSSAFTAVSCLPLGSCVAVGGTGRSKAPPLMTGVWNGKAWKLAPGF